MTGGCGRCWKCKEGTGCIRSVSFPSVGQGGRVEVERIDATDARWHSDMPAYRELRRQGLQPPRIDGCHDLAQRASDQFEIEMGTTVPKWQHDQVKDGLAIAKELEVIRPKSVQVSA